jgi:L-ribulose-5-phosphate 3-epimerase
MNNQPTPLGFMQGRLCALVNGKIQAFPWDEWQTEFPAAQKLQIHMMEWTLDQERLYENPLMTPQGQEEIRALCSRHEMRIPSLTGDCFMQAPFWKASGQERSDLERDFLAIAHACHAVGIEMIVVPLVDNGGLSDRAQEDDVVNFMLRHASLFASLSLRIIFECDFIPRELARLIDRLPAEGFGINYDIGNSAALGFDPAEEFAAYGPRIVNVHVKDRVLGGTTVPLGTGNAKLQHVFDLLHRQSYRGNYIMQTARAKDHRHAETLAGYRDLIEGWIAHAR